MKNLFLLHCYTFLVLKSFSFQNDFPSVKILLDLKVACPLKIGTAHWETCDTIYNTVWSQQILVQGFMTIKTKIFNENNLQQFKYVVWKSDFSSFLLDMWIHWNNCADMLLHLRNTHWLSHCTNQLRSVYLQSHCKEYQKTRNN